ncbi:unnamed protein product, partial [Cylicostephanus goldi]
MVDSKENPPTETPPAPEDSGSADSPSEQSKEQTGEADRSESTTEKPEDADLKILNKEEHEEEFAEIDLTKYASAKELEALGLQHLKHALKNMVTVKRLSKKRKLSNKKFPDREDTEKALILQNSLRYLERINFAVIHRDRDFDTNGGCSFANKSFIVSKISTITTNPASSTKNEDSDDKKVKGEASASVLIEDAAKKIQEMKDQGRVALTALKKHLANHSGKSLFPDIDHAVGVLVVYKALSSELSHSPRTTSNTSVCLIMPDLDQSATARKDPDVEKQARQWAEKIEKDHGLTSQHYSK